MAICGINAFATATVVEAVELRQAGLISAKILVLGAPLPADVPLLLQFRLDTMISSLEVAAVVAEFARPESMDDVPLNVHLYVETGMTRLGLQPYEIPRALELLRGAKHVKIVGMCSHFTESDNPQSEYVLKQMDNFDLALRAVKEHPLGKDLELDVHFGNSGALIDARFHEHLKGRYPGGISRPGVSLYGCYPQQSARHTALELGQTADVRHQEWVKREICLHNTAAEQLAEAMTLVAKVTNVMVVEKGQSVGYSRTWCAPDRCVIATLGIGYADGYPRAASNKAQVSIRGRYYPIAGNVCMDMTMVNLGEVNGLGREVQVGDDAVLFGPGGFTASELAFHCGTIQHELLSGLTRRVQRIYINDEEVALQSGQARAEQMRAVDEQVAFPTEGGASS